MTTLKSKTSQLSLVAKSKITIGMTCSGHAAPTNPMQWKLIFFAAFIASLVPAALMFISFIFIGDLFWAVFAMFIAYFVSLFVTIALGIPAMLLLKRLNILNMKLMLATGFVLGFISFVCFEVYTTPTNSKSSFFSGNEWQEIDGVKTAAGWRNELFSGCGFGLLGMIVSGTYLAVLRRRQQLDSFPAS